jgi:5-(carboxyamino)imidazole ribonucleotide synthase
VTTVIPPGSTVGVLGSGQLGRMFALAARRMGYRVHTFSPETDTPTGQVADVEVTAGYDDLDAVRAFARKVQVVTFEFENVSAAAVEAAGAFAPVRPAGPVLFHSQHRLREKTYLSTRGFPVTAFRPVRSAADVPAALSAVGAPAILKTAGFGYDGKGQRRVADEAEAVAAFQALGGQEAILEALVDFQCEVSVVAARALNGAMADWGVIENVHANHILDVSVSPAPSLSPAQSAQAVEIAQAVMKSLDVVGVLCVEFFLTKSGKLLINELAPRPHNSGHLTVDASITSQFEQQLRAVCGLPLGSTDPVAAAAMANLLGDLWSGGAPRWERALLMPDVKLHLYGKADPRPGRKMGHLTALARTPADAADLVRQARRALASTNETR